MHYVRKWIAVHLELAAIFGNVDKASGKSFNRTHLVSVASLAHDLLVTFETLLVMIARSLI